MGSEGHGTTVRVGTDVVHVDEVASSVARFGDRYLHRIFTDHELESCGDTPAVAAASLAARFAAKEATIKVLRPSDLTPPWQSIEVRRHRDGFCDLRLSGEAARLADAGAITSLAVSMTHDHGVAAAVVVALTADPGAPGPMNDDR